MKIRWVIDEAMILLDALVKVLHGEAKRKDEVNAVSHELRARAVLKGIEVDDVYRNFAGIDMQMQRMESAYTGKESKLKETKLFEEAVELHKNNPSEFNRKLNEFRAETPVKEIFTRYATILKKNYDGTGFKPGSAIWTARFKNAWKSEWGEELTDEPEKIDRILKYVGTMRGGRIYPRNDEEEEAQMERIIGVILDVFDSGVFCIDAEEVFNRFKTECTENLHIYNSAELAEALQKKAGKRFCVVRNLEKEYYARSSACYPTPKDDVVRALKKKKYYEPQTLEEIREELWFIPEDRIKRALNSEESLVYTGIRGYIYAPNLPIDEDELQRIASRLNQELEGRYFMTAGGLYEIIQDEFPDVAECTAGFDPWGVRQCMRYFLRGKFSFDGNVISRCGSKKLTPQQIWTGYCRYREDRSRQEIEDFANQFVDGFIRLNIILNEMIRVNASHYVRRDQINFDVEAIDEILEKMCPGPFAPLKSVNLFLLFPEIGGWPWNEFVLESYLYRGSAKFALINLSFGKTVVSGAIVRKDSGIADYRQLVVNALADSTATGSDGAALDFLVKSGYQMRRNFKGITEIRRKAALLREQREREKSHV